MWPLAAALVVVSGVIWSQAESNNRDRGSCALTQADLGHFIHIPGGGYVQGANPILPGEGPPRMIYVSTFHLLAHEVTNAEFAAFVEATGYVTSAEQRGGSAIFSPSRQPEIPMSWWSLDSAATWRTPQGKGSSLDGLWLHPVVHITLEDARAYAAWAGGRIPTEEEWEYAAQIRRAEDRVPIPNKTERQERLERDPAAPRPSASDRYPSANVWTGLFPIINSKRDGFAETAPVGCFEPAETGAYDMIGNVWEWTSTAATRDTDRYILKGGSYLCSEDYCQGYRAEAREGYEPHFSAAHIGFRIVKDSSNWQSQSTDQISLSQLRGRTAE